MINKYLDLSEDNINRVVNDKRLEILSYNDKQLLMQILIDYREDIDDLSKLYPKRYQLGEIYENKNIVPYEVAKVLAKSAVILIEDSKIDPDVIEDVIESVCKIDKG